MPVNDFYNNSGLFIPTTFVFNAARIMNVDVNSDEFKEMLVELYTDLNDMANALNLKVSGYYTTDEFVTGSLLFPNPNASPALQPIWRQGFGQMIACGPLPNTGTSSTPHNIPITDTYSAIKIYGGATDPIGITFLPLPYVSVSGDSIEVNIDATNVNITTQSDRSNYTIANIYFEYVKQ